VKHHSKAYTGIKQQVEDMNKEATSALSKISTHNSDVKRMLLESEQASRKLATKVVIHEEDSEDDAAEKQDHIHLGAERALDVSLQRQKEDIVDKLIGMNSNMRAFSSSVEEKLQRAYKAGNYAKKFGFEGMSTKNMDEDWETKSAMSGGGAGSMTAFEKILHKDNKKLNRLQTQARNYISGGNSSDGGNRSVMSQQDRLHMTSSLPDLTSSKMGRLASAR